VGEAGVEQTGVGLQPTGDGWFVVNAADTVWVSCGDFASVCGFERWSVPFEQLGIRLWVLQPGQPNGLYHREEAQEDFLVLAGECLLLVEEEERRLKQWDFVHCPPGTRHIFVGAGDGPCAILMTSPRVPGRAIAYPVSELALRHGAGVEQETTKPPEAYANQPEETFTRPACWDELPWARG